MWLSSIINFVNTPKESAYFCVLVLKNKFKHLIRAIGLLRFDIFDLQTSIKNRWDTTMVLEIGRLICLPFLPSFSTSFGFWNLAFLSGRNLYVYSFFPEWWRGEITKTTARCSSSAQQPLNLKSCLRVSYSLTVPQDFGLRFWPRCFSNVHWTSQRVLDQLLVFLGKMKFPALMMPGINRAV